MRRNQFDLKKFIQEKRNIKINLTISAAPAKTVGAQMEIVSSLVYNNDTSKRKEKNAKYR